MKIISDKEREERKKFADFVHETKFFTHGKGRIIAKLARITYKEYDNYVNKNSSANPMIRKKIVEAILKVKEELQEKINA